MKTPTFIKIALPLIACGALMSCHSGYWGGSYAVSGSYSNGGYSTSYMYDSTGYPIYGYYGGRPIYAYDTWGNPIYSITLISRGCYIPSWGPAPYYRGRYAPPPHCHHMDRPPKMRHKPDHLHKHYDNHRPGLVHRPGTNKHVHKEAVRKHRQEILDAHRPGLTNRPGVNEHIIKKNKYDKDQLASHHRPGTTYRPGASSLGKPNHIFRPSNNHSSIRKPGEPQRTNNASFSRSSSGRSGASSMIKPVRKPQSSNIRRPGTPSSRHSISSGKKSHSSSRSKGQR